jgi:hypothetical protein
MLTGHDYLDSNLLSHWEMWWGKIQGESGSGKMFRHPQCLERHKRDVYQTKDEQTLINSEKDDLDINYDLPPRQSGIRAS